MSKQSHTNKDVGTIVSFYRGVAKIEGLSAVFVHEVLVDAEGITVAVVIGFTSAYVEALFIDAQYDTTKPVFRTRTSFSVTIGDAYIGRVVDGLGRPRDGFAAVPGEVQVPVFAQAPQLIDRKPVTRPVITGIKIVDATLPIGRGQRELIIGDRKLGKSTLATDIVLNQRRATEPMQCVYVLIGQRQQKLDELIALIESHNANLYTTIVAATADDPYVAQYLAPFVGTAIAEYFRDTGRDALIVYDDFSKHANVYRSIGLLLGRVPGREAYPGDIFSLHAELLERSAQLSDARGGGSLTALPIIETQEGDVTAYIPTNIISITDGQIYLERGLFQKHALPAVNIGLSVSRIGSQVQPPVLQRVLGGLRLALAQHKELQKLSQLETKVSDAVRAQIRRGDLLLALLRQKKHTIVTYPEQVVLFFAVEEGYFDTLDPADWQASSDVMLQLLRSQYHVVLESIACGVFNTQEQNIVKEFVRDFMTEFIEGYV